VIAAMPAHTLRHIRYDRRRMSGGALVDRVRYRRRRHLLERRSVLAPVLIAPAVIFILALVGLPLLLAIYLAFSSATSGSLSGHWVGLANFRHEWGNAIFQRALWNTFWFTVISQVIVVLGAGPEAQARLRRELDTEAAKLGASDE